MSLVDLHAQQKLIRKCVCRGGSGREMWSPFDCSVLQKTILGRYKSADCWLLQFLYLPQISQLIKLCLLPVKSLSLSSCWNTERMQGLFLCLQVLSYLRSGSSHLGKTLLHALEQLYKNLLLFLINRASHGQGEQTFTWREEWGLAQHLSGALKTTIVFLTPSSCKLLPTGLDPAPRQATLWLFQLLVALRSEATWSNAGQTLVLWFQRVASRKNAPFRFRIPCRQRLRSSLQCSSPGFHPDADTAAKATCSSRHSKGAWIRKTARPKPQFSSGIESVRDNKCDPEFPFLFLKRIKPTGHCTLISKNQGNHMQARHKFYGNKQYKQHAVFIPSAALPRLMEFEAMGITPWLCNCPLEFEFQTGWAVSWIAIYVVLQAHMRISKADLSRNACLGKTFSLPLHIRRPPYNQKSNVRWDAIVLLPLQLQAFTFMMGNFYVYS